MINFFDPQTNQSFLARIQSLTPDNTAQWGKMNVNQMLQHCIKPLQLALSEVQTKRALIGYLFGAIAKWHLTRNDKPMGKNLPTDPNFITTDSPDFEKTRQDLLAHVKKLYQAGPNGTAKNIHPFFGKMTPREWSILMAKHLDHHLSQFGA